MGVWGRKLNPGTWGAIRDECLKQGIGELVLMYAYRCFWVRFPEGKQVLSLRVEEDTELEDLEARIVARVPEVLERVVGFKGDDSLPEPDWWQKWRMGRWGTRLRVDNWRLVRDVVIAKGVPAVYLSFVEAGDGH